MQYPSGSLEELAAVLRNARALTRRGVPFSRALSLARRAGRQPDGSTLTFLPDGAAVHSTTAAHLWAEAAATGELRRVHEDGTEERLPPDPEAIVFEVRARDALRAYKQFAAVARSHRGAGPAIVRRTPSARPAARRPRARAGASSGTSSADPGDDGPGEPPRPTLLAVGGGR